MATKILDGKWLSTQVQNEVAAQVASLMEKLGKKPGLGVILVGDNPASMAYVANKEKIAVVCGLNLFDNRLPATATQDEVAEAILDFNQNSEIDGILLQLPLPKGLDEKKLLDLIDPTKDVDGLHPLNQGLLIRGSPAPRPCTPQGALALIDLAYSDVNSDLISKNKIYDTAAIKPIDLSGKKAVVIGRSILVGKPLALLLLERNATVVMAHSKSKDLAQLASSADILVAAVGVPELIKGDYVKEGGVVIDVGINRLADGRLVGDLDFNSCKDKACAITPVPGGVGPMTVVMLIKNTVASFARRNGVK
jgi:methylenetetrahydrofolate dehydrogenase (NADP+)/methenyltetrahydrofolate cyclohydrolase